MPGRFANQVAIITGASSGIGWSLAKILAGEGAKVGLVARRKDKLDALVEEIRQAGGTAFAVPANVGDREQTVAAIRQLAKELGPVDLLIANAGVGVSTMLDPVNVEDVEAMFRINVFGMVYAIEAVLPDMLRRGKGHLAGVSSMASYIGLPAQSGYCASKAAINSYLEGLRRHLRPRGITVTTICPSFVKTPMTDHHQFNMPWILEPDDAARRIARALWRKRKVYNFPWQMNLLMKLTYLAPEWLLQMIVGKYEDKVPYRPIVS